MELYVVFFSNSFFIVWLPFSQLFWRLQVVVTSSFCSGRSFKMSVSDWIRIQETLKPIKSRLWDLHHFNTDLGTIFLFYAIGSGSCSLSKWCEPATTDTPRLHIEPPRLIISVHGLLWLHFEPWKLLNFDFSADPDPNRKSGISLWCGSRSRSDFSK